MLDKIAKPVTVTLIRNPFDPWRSRDTAHQVWRENMTVAELMPLAEMTGLHMVASVNGGVVEDPTTYILQPGDSLAVCAVPEGGDTGQIVIIVAMIALAIFLPGALALIPGLATASGGLNLVGWAVYGGIMAGAGLLMQSMVPTPKVNVDPMENKSATGWTQQPNTVTEGVAVPVLYGKVRVRPPYLANHVEFTAEGIRTDTTSMTILLGLAEGPITEVSDIQINDAPLAFYDEVDTEIRLGTNDQTLIPFMDSPVVTTQVNVNVDDAPERTTTRDDIIGIQVSCIFPNGYWATTQRSKTRTYSVGWTLAAYYRLHGDTTWIEINRYSVTAEVYAKPDDPTRVGFQKLGLAPGQYDVRVAWISPPNLGVGGVVQIQSDCFVEFINELLPDKFTHPNTALLGLNAMAVSKLQGGVPMVECTLERATVQVWDPDLEEYVDKPANNPAWACYDILHHSRYGGNVEAHRLNYAAFKAWADWCEEQEFTCNIYLQSLGTIERALLQIGVLGRGIVVQQGTSFSCIVERPSDPVQMFTMGNIVAGSFRQNFLSLSERANSVEVEYHDADRNWARHIVEVQADNIDELDVNAVRQSISFEGCTNRGMAARYGKFLLNCNKEQIRTIEFEAGVDAIACTVGDVIYFQHDVPQWGYGGRVVSATDNTVTLDREVDIQSGRDYGVLVRNSETDALAERTVTNSPGATSTLTVTPVWTANPTKHDIFSFGEQTKVAKLFRVLRISRAGDQTRRITAIEYRDELYDDNIEIPDYEQESDLQAVQFLRADQVLDPDRPADITINLSWTGVGFNRWTIHRFQKVPHPTIADLFIWKIAGTTNSGTAPYARFYGKPGEVFTFQVVATGLGTLWSKRLRSQSIVVECAIPAGGPLMPEITHTEFTPEGLVVHWDNDTTGNIYTVESAGEVLIEDLQTNNYVIDTNALHPVLPKIADSAATLWNSNARLVAVADDRLQVYHIDRQIDGKRPSRLVALGGSEVPGHGLKVAVDPRNHAEEDTSLLWYLTEQKLACYETSLSNDLASEWGERPLQDPDTHLMCNFNGTIIDDAGRHTLTEHNQAAISTAVRRYGAGSLQLNETPTHGDGGYVHIPGSSDFNFGTGDFTIEAWVRPEPIPNMASRTIIALKHANKTSHLFLTKDALHWVCYDAAGNSIVYIWGAPAPLVFRQWMHVAVVRRTILGTSFFYLYANGKLVKQGQSTAAMADVTEVYIGTVDPTQPDVLSYWQGYIDDLRISKGVARYTFDYQLPGQLSHLLPATQQLGGPDLAPMTPATVTATATTANIAASGEYCFLNLNGTVQAYTIVNGAVVPVGSTLATRNARMLAWGEHLFVCGTHLSVYAFDGTAWTTVVATPQASKISTPIHDVCTEDGLTLYGAHTPDSDGRDDYDDLGVVKYVFTGTALNVPAAGWMNADVRRITVANSIIYAIANEANTLQTLTDEGTHPITLNEGARREEDDLWLTDTAGATGRTIHALTDDAGSRCYVFGERNNPRFQAGGRSGWSQLAKLPYLRTYNRPSAMLVTLTDERSYYGLVRVRAFDIWGRASVQAVAPIVPPLPAFPSTSQVALEYTPTGVRIAWAPQTGQLAADRALVMLGTIPGSTQPHKDYYSPTWVFDIVGNEMMAEYRDITLARVVRVIPTDTLGQLPIQTWSQQKTASLTNAPTVSGLTVDIVQGQAVMSWTAVAAMTPPVEAYLVYGGTSGDTLLGVTSATSATFGAFHPPGTTIQYGVRARLANGAVSSGMSLVSKYIDELWRLNPTTGEPEWWNPDTSAWVKVVTNTTTVAIAPGDWTGTTATKTVTGITTGSIIWVSPAAASYTAYAAAKIRATAQGTNSLTFTCDMVPTTTIDVEVAFT